MHQTKGGRGTEGARPYRNSYQQQDIYRDSRNSVYEAKGDMMQDGQR